MWKTASLRAAVMLCALGLSAAAQAEDADRVFVDGAVWTGERGAPLQSAFAVKGNHIVAVGGQGDVQPFIGADTKVIDLHGAFVVPGFIDNHTHFILGSADLTNVELRAVKTKEEFIRRIVERAKARPGEWVLGGNWDENYWGGELPDRRWIDAQTGDTPVLVSRYDGHSSFANSAALKAAGIDENTPNPEGGVIVRDKDGRPTGVVKDAARFLAEKAIPLPSEKALEATFKVGMRHALSHGVTQVHDMGYDWRTLKTFQRLKAEGQLGIRVYAFVPLADWQKLYDYIQANGRGDDWLRWGGLKGFMDGSLGSTTAWFHQPYADAPGSYGMPVTDPKLIEARADGAIAHGLHIAVHAIGDRANDELLDIYKRAVKGHEGEDLRLRIEHAQHLTQAAIPRFAEQNVIASMQPYHNIDDGRWAGKRLGPEQLKGTYAFHSLMKAGAHVTFGSDWPVAPLDPIMGIYAAVTRRTLDGKHPDGWIPAEKVSVEDALMSYTRENAYAGFQEDRLGRIKAGYLADFVVLSQNLMAIDPLKIPDTHILRTVIGGKDAYVGE